MENRTPLIAGNWKMFKTISEAVETSEQLVKLSGSACCCSIGVFVSIIIESPVLSPDMYASPKDVSINIIAAAVVALVKKVDAPVLPKRV